MTALPKLRVATIVEVVPVVLRNATLRDTGIVELIEVEVARIEFTLVLEDVGVVLVAIDLEIGETELLALVNAEELRRDELAEGLDVLRRIADTGTKSITRSKLRA